MYNIKAIPTQYNEVTFRSRLEARWAVFFDSLGIEWEYEPEGFTDGNIRYLPDFALYNYNNEDVMFCEVKHRPLNDYELNKAKMLSKFKDVALLIGNPKPCEYTILSTKYEGWFLGIFNFDNAYCEHRFFICSELTNNRFNSANVIDEYYLQHEDMLINACLEANKYNFK